MDTKTDKLGRKHGGGRVKGSSAVPTRIRNRLIAQAEVKPLTVLMDTMAERWKLAQEAKTAKTRTRLQDEACAVAEKVAPYLHPKLQATTLKGDDKNPLGFTLNLPTVDALKAAIRGKTDKTEKAEG